jgi:hypothetical protein
MRITGANRFFLLLTLTSVLLSPNCATFTQKSTQRIDVTSTPVGATVIVNGFEKGVTPIEIRLVRAEKNQVFRIESPGYDSVEIRLKRKLPGRIILGNFLLGLIPAVVPAGMWGVANNDEDNAEAVGILIELLGAVAFGGLLDWADAGGNGYSLEPRELTVTLTKADGTPRVDTMVVNENELRNIKWIRVRKD